ncbi:cilia- and flagella-associated protein 97 isoform X2 [Scomber japonicus]|uniref:cilia- and flagella-associated protein 97 isoform X2 n=1 Tax=Scomber japonicus TaxID=13676 RepID=UPI0023057E37|nr:cilia- and flagella-associated protein 97 isoform X2 [Scomber japonicus]
MFNPSELEGEVDHSFFDSDCDDSHASRDGGKKMDRGSKTENTCKTAGGLSPRTGGTKKYQKQDNSHLKEDVRSMSQRSSVLSKSHKVINNTGNCGNDSNLNSRKSSGTFMALLADANETEAVLPSNPKHSKERNKKSPTQHRRSPSPISSEVSTDTNSGRSPSLSPRVRRTRVRTVESDGSVTDVSPLSTPDISPRQYLDLNHTGVKDRSRKKQQQESVPSTGLSNRHHDEDSDPDVEECSLISEIQLGGKVVFSCPGRRNRKNFSFTNDDVRRIDRENQRLLRKLSRISPTSRPGSAAGRKSHTGNDLPVVQHSHSALQRQQEQQRIERDNLDFLKRLESVKASPGLKRSEQLADYQRLSEYPVGPPPPIYTSTTNKERTTSKGIKRQREQRRIERDNLAFLKRLESVKASPGLKRSEQLADYQRLSGYPGGPQPPIYTSTTSKERSTSRMASGKGSRSASAAHHSRAASITSDFSSTSVPMSKKLSSARPAWC